jgi:Ca2+-binding EF-hand superfamily protein
MGCASSRFDKSQEEVVLETLERNLLFCKNSACDVDLIVRKYSFQGVINENHWRNIVKILNLNYTSENIKEFYRCFESKDKGFYLNKILVLGILNGNDSKENKARLLFEAFDTLDSKIADKSTLRYIFDSIIECSVESVKSLVKVMNQGEKEEKLIEFLQTIGAKVRKVRKTWTENIMQDEENVSMNRFIEYMKNDQDMDLLSPVGVRHTLKKFKIENKDS